MWKRPSAGALIAALTVLTACDDDASQHPDEPQDRMAYWEDQATLTAKKNAEFEFGCESLEAETIDRNDAIMVKWYSIGVSGCGKKALYDVTCANSQCDADRKGEIAEAADGGTADEAPPAELTGAGDAAPTGAQPAEDAAGTETEEK